MAAILPVFLPFAGCGGKCVFCDQKAITKQAEPDDIIASARQQIINWKSFTKNINEIAFYGGNFGALKPDVRQNLYSLAHEYGINGIRFSTRPETITPQFINEIKQLNVTLVELGVQSLDDRVLSLNGRPYGRQDVFNAIDALVSRSVPCGVQLMTGMYGQSMVSCIDDAKTLAAMKISTARIYPTQVFRNTALFNLMKNGSYVPPSFTETLIAVGGMYVVFKSENVNVIRMGLPDEAFSDGTVEAGVRHKAFGDIVKTFVTLLYFQSGGRCVFFGYKGVVKRFFPDVFPTDRNMGGIGFNQICRRVRRYFLEDSQRFFEGYADSFAKRLQSEAYNR